MTGIVPRDTAAQPIANLQLQTEALLARLGYQANPQYLYIVDGSAFGNNIRRALDMISANPALIATGSTFTTEVVSTAASDIFGVVLKLYAAGARHIVLVNSSNLGLHPAVPSTAKPLATGLATAFNGALATQVLPGVKAAAPGVNVYYVDAGALSNDFVANPAKYGFANTTAPCYPFFSAPSAPICANPAQYVFWDELHPTTAVHGFIAQAAIAAIGR
jgi:outer membrane lipase/esterase